MTACWPVDAQTLLATSSIWAASSRVGVMMSARGYALRLASPRLALRPAAALGLALALSPLASGFSTSPGFSTAMRCSVGNINAAVLPVPVCADATTSFPARTAGIAAACTGVGALNPSVATPARICSFSPSSAKVISIQTSILMCND